MHPVLSGTLCTSSVGRFARCTAAAVAAAQATDSDLPSPQDLSTACCGDTNGLCQGNDYDTGGFISASSAYRSDSFSQLQKDALQVCIPRECNRNRVSKEIFKAYGVWGPSPLHWCHHDCGVCRGDKFVTTNPSFADRDNPIGAPQEAFVAQFYGLDVQLYWMPADTDIADFRLTPAGAECQTWDNQPTPSPNPYLP